MMIIVILRLIASLLMVPFAFASAQSYGLDYEFDTFQEKEKGQFVGGVERIWKETCVDKRVHRNEGKYIESNYVMNSIYKEKTNLEGNVTTYQYYNHNSDGNRELAIWGAKESKYLDKSTKRVVQKYYKLNPQTGQMTEKVSERVLSYKDGKLEVKTERIVPSGNSTLAKWHNVKMDGLWSNYFWIGEQKLGAGSWEYGQETLSSVSICSYEEESDSAFKVRKKVLVGNWKGDLPSKRNLTLNEDGTFTSEGGDEAFKEGRWSIERKAPGPRKGYILKLQTGNSKIEYGLRFVSFQQIQLDFGGDYPLSFKKITF